MKHASHGAPYAINPFLGTWWGRLADRLHADDRRPAETTAGLEKEASRIKSREQLRKTLRTAEAAQRDSEARVALDTKGIESQ